MTDVQPAIQEPSIQIEIKKQEALNAQQAKNKLINAREYIKDLSNPLPSLKQHLQSKNKLNEEEAKLVKEKKVSLHEMVNYKREILLSKIKIENKKKHMKELEEYVNDLEKQINQKMETMNKNTNIVRKNFHDLKKDVEQLKKTLNELENTKKDKLSELSATENEIYQRELEKRKSEEEAKTYTYYKEFIMGIYGHFNAEFDEKIFRHYIEKVTANPDDTKKAYFYLTENKTMDFMNEGNAKEMMNPVDCFVNMLETIEEDNFALIYQLQNKEMNNFELDRIKPEITENSAAKLEELEKNYQELLTKEKELREKIKESSQYEKEVLTEVISSKELKKQNSKKNINNIDEGTVLDMNEVRKKLIETLQSNDLPFNPEMTPIELLKILEVYFEKLNYDATLIASTYPEYYHRKLREHTTMIKKDTHKNVELKSKKKKIENSTMLEEKLKKVNVLKHNRKDMPKSVLKAEKKAVAKNDFNPEKYEYERYFT